MKYIQLFEEFVNSSDKIMTAKQQIDAKVKELNRIMPKKFDPETEGFTKSERTPDLWVKTYDTDRGTITVYIGKEATDWYMSAVVTDTPDMMPIQFASKKKKPTKENGDMFKEYYKNARKAWLSALAVAMFCGADIAP